jgi:hypothetical protein
MPVWVDMHVQLAAHASHAGSRLKLQLLLPLLPLQSTLLLQQLCKTMRDPHHPVCNMM